MQSTGTSSVRPAFTLQSSGDQKMIRSPSFFVLLCSAAILSGCESEMSNQAVEITEVAEAQKTYTESAIVWAMNVAGDAYTGSDGIQYEAESSVSGGETGTLELVKGSQDPTLYQTFRTGDVRRHAALCRARRDRRWPACLQCHRQRRKPHSRPGRDGLA